MKQTIMDLVLIRYVYGRCRFRLVTLVVIATFLILIVRFFFRLVVGVEIDVVFFGVGDLLLDLLVHEGVFEEDLHVTEVLDDLDDVKLVVEAVLRFVYHLDDFLLVFPAATEDVEGPKLILQVVAQGILFGHLEKSVFSQLVRWH